MSELTERLDKVANSLEKQGLLKEAMDLDRITNTIEAMEIEAIWRAVGSIQSKILDDALGYINAGKPDQALIHLTSKTQAMTQFLSGHQDTPTATNTFPARVCLDSFNQALASLQNRDIQGATQNINTAKEALVELEPIIQRGGMAGGHQRDIAQQVQQGMGGAVPGAAPARRAPLQHPARALR